MIISSNFFEFITLIVIIFNSISMGLVIILILKSQIDPLATSKTTFQSNTDTFLLYYYTIEFVLKVFGIFN